MSRRRVRSRAVAGPRPGVAAGTGAPSNSARRGKSVLDSAAGQQCGGASSVRDASRDRLLRSGAHGLGVSRRHRDRHAAPADAPDVLALVPLVRSIVGHARLPSGTIERDDLFQVGMEAVVRAATRYRPDSPATFSTFAAHRIRGAMQDYLRSERPGTRRYPAVRPRSLEESVGDQRDGGQMLLGEKLLSWDPEPSDPLLLAQVETLIDALPGALSCAVRLSAEADLSIHDIATIEGVSDTAINQRLKRARAILKPRIERLMSTPLVDAGRPPSPAWMDRPPHRLVGDPGFRAPTPPLAV